MSYECEVKDQAPQPALSMRKKSPVEKLPEVMGSVYGAIAHYMEELGEQPAGPPYTAYFNMDMQNLDVEIGIPVTGKLAAKGDIQPTELPGGKVATCLHTGPYNEVGQAYEALTAWTREKGYEPGGAPYEMYLNDPGETAPEALQTLVVFPLKTG